MWMVPRMMGTVLAVVLVVAWGAAGWGAAAQTGDLDPLPRPVKVRIAEDGAASGAGFYLAEALGYFKAYNIEVERSEEHTSELQSRENLVCRLLLEKKKPKIRYLSTDPSMLLD